MTRLAAAFPAAFFLVLLLLASCNGPSAEQRNAPPSDSAAAGPDGTAAGAARVERARCPGPLKVAVMQDKSGSAQEHRTPQLAADQLAPVVERLRACGGELAVGLIRSASNRSLTRLYLPRPELPPRPEKPSREEFSNAFDYDQAMTQYNRALPKAKRARRAARVRHQRQMDQRVEAFNAEVAELLETPPQAQHTDVMGGLRRAELYLNEPGAGEETSRALILISDARDTQDRPPVEWPLASGAQVLLVNSAPSMGAFEGLEPKPVQLESISSAMRYWNRHTGLP